MCVISAKKRPRRDWSLLDPRGPDLGRIYRILLEEKRELEKIIADASRDPQILFDRPRITSIYGQRVSDLQERVAYLRIKLKSTEMRKYAVTDPDPDPGEEPLAPLGID